MRTFPAGKEGEKAFDFECVRSNIQHGLPLTRQERDRAIVQMWKRWGLRTSGSGGETLDELGALFNLTKQRIHQILANSQASAESTPSSTGRAPRPGGFSPFGRFSAATRRLSRLLADSAFIDELLEARHSEVFRELERLRAQLADLLRLKA